jgi:hypothetical protein
VEFSQFFWVGGVVGLTTAVILLVTQRIRNRRR